MFLNKLSLGTVQFGIPYGINNTLGLPEQNELIKIFITAREHGLEMLDTAPSYGDAEEKIGKYSDHHFNVVTKFSNVKNGSELKNSLNNSLFKLKQDKVYGFIAHNADQLISSSELWDDLNEIKANGQAKKIGFSLYSTEQLETLLIRGLMPDLVQLPYSLLDRKFSPFFAHLKSIGTEIHVRSVFLQGLYFIRISKLPAKLLPLKPALEEIYHLSHESNLLINSLALNFVLDNPFIDKVVIGIDSVRQLSENIHTVKTWVPIPGLNDRINQINVLNPELLNPVNW